MARRLKSMLTALIVAILVIGAAVGFLIHQGKWNDVVAVYAEILGTEAGEKIDQYGHGANDVYETTREYAGGIVDDLRTGTYREVNWPDLSELLDNVEPVPKTEPRHASYDRAAFGPSWQDVDGNSCDTRNDILQRDLEEFVLDSDGCTVLSGTFHDPYTGTSIDFRRGVDTSRAVQVDHIVPLKLAWDLGAWKWDDKTRAAFANDPENLFAADGPTNGSKSDKSISEWMPPNEAFRCTYTAAYTSVFAKYDLAMSDADQKVVAEMIERCS